MVYETIKKFIKEGDVLENPKSGTSTILKIDENEIIYKRGKSSLHIKAEDINSAYDHFKGQLVSTSDLAEFNINFSQRKHRCNASFFLLLMNLCGLTEGGIINGRMLSAKLK